MSISEMFPKGGPGFPRSSGRPGGGWPQSGRPRLRRTVSSSRVPPWLWMRACLSQSIPPGPRSFLLLNLPFPSAPSQTQFSSLGPEPRVTCYRSEAETPIHRGALRVFWTYGFASPALPGSLSWTASAIWLTSLWKPAPFLIRGLKPGSKCSLRARLILPDTNHSPFSSAEIILPPKSA